MSTDSEKDFKLFIAFHCPKTSEFGVWVSENIVLREVTGPEMIGWEHELYVDIAKKLFSSDMSISQAVLASIYVLTVAENTSNYVKGPLSVAVAKSNGIWMERSDYVSTMNARLNSYTDRINQIFLACADTRVHAFQLEEKIKEFSEFAVDLHRQNIDENVAKLNFESLFGSNDAYPKYPPGSIIAFGTSGFTFEHNKEQLQAEIERFKAMAELVKNESAELKVTKPSEPPSSEDQQ